MTHRYSLPAATDRLVTVRVAGDSDVLFDVVARGIMQSRRLSPVGGVRVWTGNLSPDADNAIEVHAPEHASRYTLEVFIN